MNSHGKTLLARTHDAHPQGTNNANAYCALLAHIITTIVEQQMRTMDVAVTLSLLLLSTHFTSVLNILGHVGIDHDSMIGYTDPRSLTVTHTPPLLLYTRVKCL
jgi:hypothetical protein